MNLLKQLSICIFLSFLNFGLFGQGNKEKINVSEAEFSESVFYVNQKNDVVKLENNRASFKVKKNALSIISGGLAGRSGTKLLVSGHSSSVQLVQKDKMYFVYTATDNSLNPDSKIILYKFNLTPDNNRVTSVSEHVGALAGDNSAFQNIVKYKVEKYKKQSYLIEIDKLEVGEYGFVLGLFQGNGVTAKEAPIVYMFSVVDTK